MNKIDVLYFSRMSIARNSPNQLKLKRLIDKGVNVIAVTTWGDVPENGNETPSKYLFERRWRLPNQKAMVFKALNQIIAACYLIYGVIQFRPRIIISHDSNMILLLIIFKFLMRKVVIVDFHEIIWDCGYSKLLSYFYKINELFFAKHLDYAIYPSFARREIISSFNKLRCEFAIIPNYPDRSILNLPYSKSYDSSIRLVYYGAVNSITFAPLLASILNLTKRSSKIDIYGFGSHLNRLQEQLNQHSNVRFLCAMEHKSLMVLLDAYTASICVYSDDCLNNIFCEPRKLYESIARGLPVIINNLKSPRVNFITSEYVLLESEYSAESVFDKKGRLIKSLSIVHAAMEQAIEDGHRVFFNFVSSKLINKPN
jgi:glycosyltransferase involved in cell wall biosynthesis